jgi:hypothetical protein
MRLLDQVAQSRVPLKLALENHAGRHFEVTGASQFSSDMARCPLRFVMGDDLARASAELAFADGARLVDWLDLLHMPAQQLWVEWNDEVHKRVMFETHSTPEFDPGAVGRRVGMLLQSGVDGLTAIGRTFWIDASCDASANVTVSPLETHFDFRAGFEPSEIEREDSALGFLQVRDGRYAAMASLMHHVRFRFDQSWSTFYNAAASTTAQKDEVLRDSLATVARDAPFILAFLLLLSARNATRSVPICRTAINRKRSAHGRAFLLDHVEVNACLDAAGGAESDGEIDGRQSPRLHHVRGHLVRRDQRIFWRVPHLRGSASRGMVRSRTVCLAFSRQREDARI